MLAELDSGLALRTAASQHIGLFGLYVGIVTGLLLELLRAYLAEMGLRTDAWCTKDTKRGA